MEDIILLKEEIRRLEESLHSPDIRTSPEKINQLLSDDFFEFGASGNKWTKADCVGDDGLAVLKVKIIEFDLHTLSPGVVLATYLLHDELREEMKYTWRSSIWKQRDGRWQMFFHQGTPIKK
ncbi:nuclear transport factor 2 family protein [Litchfieldia salsa]|uniref:DUF4440 domain-containing protein n=1 Tax=Litchfieldia salsa TaxID=930152 RepID=A0A1H0U1V0_9BACI|nr:DUF4440 domain-containing protein [Litchfieldia salsa]SDP59786.1 hypothetical protein SAMN05216565_10470 [Litchfieldia salsa]